MTWQNHTAIVTIEPEKGTPLVISAEESAGLKGQRSGAKDENLIP
jgi:hypothetical protein